MKWEQETRFVYPSRQRIAEMISQEWDLPEPDARRQVDWAEVGGAVAAFLFFLALAAASGYVYARGLPWNHG